MVVGEFVRQIRNRMHAPDCPCAQKPVDLDDDLASAMAVLALSMRGPGAIGTTAMECRSVAPTTLHNILEVTAAPQFEPPASCCCHASPWHACRSCKARLFSHLCYRSMRRTTSAMPLLKADVHRGPPARLCSKTHCKYARSHVLSNAASQCCQCSSLHQRSRACSNPHDLRCTTDTLRLRSQEVAQHFRLLLELGAEVEGSPAAERLQQLFCTYWAVSLPVLT